MKMQELPHNIEIEQQVLGSIMKNPQHPDSQEAIDLIDINDFYTLVHRRIFAELKSMSERKEEITFVLLDENLKNIGDDYGGLLYLAEMVKRSVGQSALTSYRKAIKKFAQVRELSILLNETARNITNLTEPTETIEELETALKTISTDSNGKELRHMRDLEGGFLDALEERAERGGAIAGLSTGIEQLDERLGGINDESLIVIAGGPSMGKTLFCQSLATNISIDQQKNTMFFSMEMSEGQIFERFVSGIGNVAPHKIRTAMMSKEDLGRVHSAVVQIRDSNLYITDESRQSVGQIRAKARRHKIKHPGLSAIFIDYLGLMKIGQADRHDIAIGEVTRSLKELAKEIKVPIFLCVQAKRWTNIKERPNMSSLKDSSCIEADADVILFVHRQEVIEPETELKGITELIIAKDRHNDGNGTIYMEKTNGAFVGLTTEQAAQIEHQKQVAKMPPKKERGFKQDKSGF